MDKSTFLSREICKLLPRKGLLLIKKEANTVTLVFWKKKKKSLLRGQLRGGQETRLLNMSLSSEVRSNFCGLREGGVGMQKL